MSACLSVVPNLPALLYSTTTTKTAIYANPNPNPDATSLPVLCRFEEKTKEDPVKTEKKRVHGELSKPLCYAHTVPLICNLYTYIFVYSELCC
jgi:hypothetical protein